MNGSLRIELPGRADGGLLGLLDEALALAHTQFVEDCGSAGIDAGAGPLRWNDPGARAPAAAVPIVPGLALEPDLALIDFLRESDWRLDHVGLAIAADALPRSGWEDWLAGLAGCHPAWRLMLPGTVDTIIALPAGSPAALELAYGAPFSSLHVCLALDQPRALLEQRFPPPRGGYKPGDEPFFLSVALPTGMGLPAYLDLAFADGGLTAWPGVVAALGQRLGEPAARHAR